MDEFCGNCGAKLDLAISDVCPNCGAKQGASKFVVEEARGKYGGFWVRFVAAFIDGLILFIPLIICLALVGFGEGQSGSNKLWLGYFLFLIVWFIYFAVLESSSRRGTFGKQAMGLIVINMDGSQLTFSQASVRTIGKLASAVILYIGFIMIGFTENKQGLHDMIAKTYVIKK